MALPPLFESTETTVADLLDRHESLAERAAADGVLHDALIRLADASRSITAAIRSNPDAASLIADDDRFRVERDPAQYLAARADSFADEGADDSALRRFKRREFARIAARDLLGLADLPTVGRELSGLADAVIAGGLQLADAGDGFAVIGMGKLGGNELNYSSDIDVIFVHEGDATAAIATARRFIKAVGASTADGMAWRVDADLRPEGSSGVLSRSVDSCQTYYEQRAEAWERQAMLKARWCGGDRAVATAFFDAVMPTVWTTRPRPDGIRYIRTLKDRAEGLLKVRAERDLKRGPGGIRDVEFAVQLLQLVHGGRDPAVRATNTFDALHQLVRAGHLEIRDADHLGVALKYLRTVEHRIQLRDERQTHDLPTSPADLDWLARVMGHTGDGHMTATDQFQAQLERHRSSVRTIHQRVFRRPTITAMLEARPVDEEGPAAHLGHLGFHEPERGAELLERISGGHTPGARLLRELTPLILDSLAESTEPDLGLLRLSWLLDGPSRRDRVLTSFRESPTLIARTCRLLGSSAVIAGALRSDPSLVDMLAADIEAPDDTVIAAEVRAAFVDLDDVSPALAVIRREQTRLAAAALLDGVGPRQIGPALSRLADLSLDAAITCLSPEVPLAVIGLGRLGTSDLSFSSDLDVIVVSDPQPGDDGAANERAVQRLVSSFDDTRGGGRLWEVDSRLRPEGANGRMAPSLTNCARYYETRAQMWEFQALLRARAVAGDATVAQRFLDLVTPHVYRPGGLGSDGRDELIRIKRRIDTERRPPGPAGRQHLKLGPGGLVDVEFAVQLLQLEHGHGHPELRGLGPVAALPLLAELGLVSEQGAGDMARAYELCEHLRNVRHLQRSREADVWPDDPVDAEAFASLAGYGAAADLEAEAGETLTASATAAGLVLDQPH